jgi:hypothetical protein
MAEGVRVSDVILAPVPAQPSDPLEPLIDRVSGSAVVACLEMHAEDRGRLPEAVRVVISRGALGSELVTVAADVTRRDGGWAIARAVVPTVDLQPGPYVARAEVVANGRTIARVARPFTIPER